MSFFYRGAASRRNNNSIIPWASVAASVPVLIWARDSLVGTCRIQGRSMEPTLHDGDLVLIRKCEPGVLPKLLWSLLWRGNNSDSDSDTDSDRARLLQQEGRLGMGSNDVPQGRLYDRPPLALSGQVVVYQNPETAFPSELCVKRVIAVDGQYLRARISPRGRILQTVPSYSLYVEGDNDSNSRDSRHVGPISKGLLVGVAEYVLWPPSRMCRIRRVALTDDHGRPRATWP
jgi:signal peptidase I